MYFIFTRNVMGSGLTSVSSGSCRWWSWWSSSRVLSTSTARTPGATGCCMTGASPSPSTSQVPFWCMSIDVIRNSVFSGKTQLINRGVQTKVAYFILLKSTYRITNWTPYRYFLVKVTYITVNLCLYLSLSWIFPPRTSYGLSLLVYLFLALIQQYYLNL